MTVQITPVNDDKAPVFDHMGIFKKITLRSVLIPIPLALLIWLISGRREFFSWYFLFMFLVFVINTWLVKSKMILSKGRNMVQPIHDYYKQQIVAQGFHVDYESPGILIDDTAKKIAFTIDPERKPQYMICDYGDIQGWKLHQKDVIQRRDYHINFDTGRVTGGNYVEMTANAVTVFINYAPQPRHGFWVSHEHEAEMWSARLNSLLNGQ